MLAKVALCVAAVILVARRCGTLGDAICRYSSTRMSKKEVVVITRTDFRSPVLRAVPHIYPRGDGACCCANVQHFVNQTCVRAQPFVGAGFFGRSFPAD